MTSKVIQVLPLYETHKPQAMNHNNYPIAQPIGHVHAPSFARVRPLESFIAGPGMGDDPAAITFSERELILIEGYKIARVVRYTRLLFFAK